MRLASRRRLIHKRPMLSLANAFTAEELAAWEERNARLAAEVRTGGYTAEIKIDGAAVSLTSRRTASSSAQRSERCVPGSSRESRTRLIF